MDPTTVVADPAWYQTAIENGAAYLVVVALFVVALGMLLRNQAKDRKASADAIRESARLNGRVNYEVGKAIRSQAHQSQRVATTLTALISAVEAQPDRYVVEKHRARNGGWQPEEIEEKKRKIEAAEAKLRDATASTDEYRPSCDPDESIEDRIERLRLAADLASSQERANELRRRAAALEAELTTS